MILAVSSVQAIGLATSKTHYQIVKYGGIGEAEDGVRFSGFGDIDGWILSGTQCRCMSEFSHNATHIRSGHAQALTKASPSPFPQIRFFSCTATGCDIVPITSGHLPAWLRGHNSWCLPCRYLRRSTLVGWNGHPRQTMLLEPSAFKEAS
ncbi:uncharacterized protein BO80DRAFT_255848 [Aspergillus ibericus CBS 121593]|uniref:Uncharacterized protein n=1 Tax=Aspergillus ibericus CBS 121593 TaxID=1448316 RepID=A0A395H9A8_9EURO|nr:hypothetical protein BO80DRAFT_255848 [Aspergillus ibericus CBS 121593]RAL04093.1 hypothetical protein BO80DRAFT_255848 [Aspergillus ibericus CBS 121593]